MLWAPEAFSLTINSIVSFVTGLVLTSIILLIIRPKSPRLRYFFWLLPFVKIPFDIALGVPNWACVSRGVSLLSTVPGTNSLQASLGFGGVGPFVTLEALTTANGTESTCSWSLGDLIHLGLVQYGHSLLPQIILAAMIAVSLVKVCQRIAAVGMFEAKRRRLRGSEQSTPLFGLAKSVDTYISSAHYGSPFTGGITAPYVCFPAKTLQALSESERKAVWNHELAHVRWRDSAVNLAIDLLGDLFWFVPGYKALKRRIFAERELAADANAVSAGSEPLSLATALLTLCERGLATTPTSASYAGLFFGTTKTLVERRVAYLAKLASAAEKRGTKRVVTKFSLLAGYLVWLAVAMTLSTSTLGGYSAVNTTKREIKPLDSMIPQFLNQFFPHGGEK